MLDHARDIIDKSFEAFAESSRSNNPLIEAADRFLPQLDDESVLVLAGWDLLASEGEPTDKLSICSELSLLDSRGKVILKAVLLPIGSQRSLDPILARYDDVNRVVQVLDDPTYKQRSTEEPRLMASLLVALYIVEVILGDTLLLTANLRDAEIASLARQADLDSDQLWRLAIHHHQIERSAVSG